MHYNVSKIDETTRYEYIFDDSTSCIFSVSKAGVIYIDIRENIIKKSNDFLKILARKKGYKPIYSRGISFSVWVKH